MVLLTVLHSELEEMLQLKDAVTDKSSVIGLADGGDADVVDDNSKLGELGSGELLIVGQLVQSVAEDTALLHANLVKDWTHQALVPLNKGQSVGQSVRQVNQTLSSGSR